MSIDLSLTQLTLARAAMLLARRALSPVELTEAHLARIEQVDPRLNSFISVTAEQALAQAHAAEREIARGDSRGPLHGVPLALKDLIETAGTRTTAGSQQLRDHVPTEDAFVVRRLKEAGAILLGKLNMHEWAMDVTTINPFYGTCRNPWDPERIPGGSSGGSGAALAAELCLGALGSDTAGSIRIPASLCGVVGLKPTFGRVSRRGVLPLSWSLDHVGPMARRVRDVALLLQALAGYDAADPYSLPMPVPDYSAELDGGVRGWRVALLTHSFEADSREAEPEVLAAVRAAARQVEAAGAQVEEVALPNLGGLWPPTAHLLMSDALATHRARLDTQPDGFSPETLQSLRRAERITGEAVARARQRQVALCRHLDDFFTRYDLLLTPTTSVAAPLIAAPFAHRDVAPPLISYTAPFNLTGLPALSLPCGFTASGLPIGLQMVGPAWSEARLLRAAQAYEVATAWHERRPEVEQGLQK